MEYEEIANKLTPLPNLLPLHFDWKDVLKLVFERQSIPNTRKNHKCLVNQSYETEQHSFETDLLGSIEAVNLLLGLGYEAYVVLLKDQSLDITLEIKEVFKRYVPDMKEEDLIPLTTSIPEINHGIFLKPKHAKKISQLIFAHVASNVYFEFGKKEDWGRVKVFGYEFQKSFSNQELVQWVLSFVNCDESVPSLSSTSKVVCPFWIDSKSLHRKVLEYGCLKLEVFSYHPKRLKARVTRYKKDNPHLPVFIKSSYGNQEVDFVISITPAVNLICKLFVFSRTANNCIDVLRFKPGCYRETYFSRWQLENVLKTVEDFQKSRLILVQQNSSGLSEYQLSYRMTNSYSVGEVVSNKLIIPGLGVVFVSDVISSVDGNETAVFFSNKSSINSQVRMTSVLEVQAKLQQIIFSAYCLGLEETKQEISVLGNVKTNASGIDEAIFSNQKLALFERITKAATAFFTGKLEHPREEALKNYKVLLFSRVERIMNRSKLDNSGDDDNSSTSKLVSRNRLLAEEAESLERFLKFEKDVMET